MVESVELELGGRTLTIETGKLAKQATGSVTVRCGDTIVLVTATVEKEPKEGLDFFPLTCNYIEKTFAAGKIPGGFFKREGRPSEIETLTSRFIDRPIRPLFPKSFKNETQVIATVLSADIDNEADMLAMVGSSAALALTPAPFMGPIGGVRVGRINGEFKINPTPTEMDEADIDLIVAGTKDGVMMVEGGGQEVSEKDMIDAIDFGHDAIKTIVKVQEELVKKVGVTKWEVTAVETNADLKSKAESFLKGKLEAALAVPEKQARSAALSDLKKGLIAELCPDGAEDPNVKEVGSIYGEISKEWVRANILKNGKRIDGRTTKDVRNISCEVGLLPRTHGSGLFTRGETQALAVATFGTKDDQQIIDALGESYKKRFMLHYNFPPFSTGEVKFMRSPGRREIGHGALAERSLSKVLPKEEDFPYTIRLVSEVLESNGSSSMATVCGGSLALMDAGVPIKSAVSGIAMGLIMEGKDYAILSDILGDEDHLGDMDFKVAGTRDGITALQMDIKIAGLSKKILEEALTQAKEGRLHILDEMAKCLSEPRSELSPMAPKIVALKIDPAKIGALIGPGGSVIRGITEETGAKVDVENDGTVHIYAADQESGDAALKKVRGVTAVPEAGKYYKGKVVKIMDFGAFVNILPNCDGLVHISQLDSQRVKQVSDVVKEGDEVVVKVLEIDKGGKIRLSKKDGDGHESEVVEL